MSDWSFNDVRDWMGYVGGLVTAGGLAIWKLRGYAADIEESNDTVTKLSEIVRGTNDRPGIATRMSYIEQSVADHRAIIYREHGKLNVMTEDRHLEVCGYNSEAIEKEYDEIKRGYSGVNADVRKLQTDVSEIKEMFLRASPAAELQAIRAMLRRNNVLLQSLTSVMGRSGVTVITPEEDDGR